MILLLVVIGLSLVKAYNNFKGMVVGFDIGVRDHILKGIQHSHVNGIVVRDFNLMKAYNNK
jgi:hypothetical protein